VGAHFDLVAFQFSDDSICRLGGCEREDLSVLAELIVLVD